MSRGGRKIVWSINERIYDRIASIVVMTVILISHPPAGLPVIDDARVDDINRDPRKDPGIKTRLCHEKMPL